MMHTKVLTLCIDTSVGGNNFAECLDSVAIIPSVRLLDTLLLVPDADNNATETAREYAQRYPELFRIELRDEAKTIVEQAALLAEGKYLRPIGSDCVVEPTDMDLLLRFLSDCGDDMVVHGCTLIDQSTGEKRGCSVPLGMIGRGNAIRYATELMADLPSQSAVVKTELVRKSGRVHNWGNDYSELFINGLIRSATVGGVDADLCRFSAPVSMVYTDGQQLEKTIFGLTELLNVYSASPERVDAVSACVAKRIANLSLARLSLWLSVPCDSVIRDDIYSFFLKLRRANKQVFDCFDNNKFVKRLRIGKFMYRSVANAYQKKNK